MTRRTSIAFDRAAEYYDATRGLSEEGTRRNTQILVEELRRRGPVLEVGVGTGQISIPLSEAGVEVVGLDLAMPMLAKLIGKCDGRSPFPLVQGDATRLPFADDAFGGAFLRWVLHLIPEWRTCLAEMVRAVRSGGVLLILMGAYGGPQSEIQERFVEITGVSSEPPGLTWAGWEQLDAEMARLGTTRRELPPFVETDRDDLESFMRGVEGNMFSWTWKVEDDDLRTRAATEARRWAEERYGPLDRAPRGEFEIAWRAYDLPT